MKKILLDGNKQRFKTNLHCHTTVSDGLLTPEQVKEAYKKKGYSVVAFTDHDVMIDHSDLTDKDFIALNGYEIEINENPREDKDYKKCHICFIQSDPKNLTQVCWHREKYLFGNAINYKGQVCFDEKVPDFERVHTGECISEAMKTARDNGFFVTYNHPTWSGEDYTDYMNYHGMHAMEICNNGCVTEGFDDYNPRVYDDMLRGGEKIFCISADDNHNEFPLDHPKSDSFGAFTVVFAEELSYEAIMDSLFKGDFYASQGPEIYSLWHDEKWIYITCSPATKISMMTNRNVAQATYATEKPLTTAKFRLFKEDKYVRLTVRDKAGKHANTIAYFINEEC